MAEPLTANVAIGVVEPMPTFPDGNTVKKDCPDDEATLKIGAVCAEDEATSPKVASNVDVLMECS